jgi:hypothetical protein
MKINFMRRGYGTNAKNENGVAKTGKASAMPLGTAEASDSGTSAGGLFVR